MAGILRLGCRQGNPACSELKVQALLIGGQTLDLQYLSAGHCVSAVGNTLLAAQLPEVGARFILEKFGVTGISG